MVWGARFECNSSGSQLTCDSSLRILSDSSRDDKFTAALAITPWLILLRFLVMRLVLDDRVTTASSSIASEGPQQHMEKSSECGSRSVA